MKRYFMMVFLLLIWVGLVVIVVVWALDCLVMLARVTIQALISDFCIGGDARGGEIVCLGSTRINKTFECCCQFARGVRLVALIAFLMV